jgi:hypothetical protein
LSGLWVVVEVLAAEERENSEVKLLAFALMAREE